MRDPLRTALVVGTRPEVIKLAPLQCALAAWPDAFAVELWAVAQQAALLESALAEARLAPALRISWQRGEESLAEALAGISARVAAALADRRPELVVVQGDTTTALAAALAARYAGIPVAHVEAGVRSSEPPGPFPEEIHRRLIAGLAAHHYAPTARARANLLREGVAAAAIRTVGNTGIDALFDEVGRAPLASAASSGRRRILVTMHRRESFGAPLQSICRALRQLVDRRDDVEIDWILHSHPEARRAPLAELAHIPGIALVEACSHREFLAKLAACRFVLTDSGGVQEEAPYLGKPALIARAASDRPESLDAGVACLVGFDANAIVKLAGELLDDSPTWQRMARRAEPFGDGRACERIRNHLAEHFELRGAGPSRARGRSAAPPRPDAARMLDWLIRAPAKGTDGSVLSWLDAARRGYPYPEAAALLLLTLVNEGLAPELRRRIGDWLVAGRLSGGGIGRDGIAYAFDTTIALSAWSAERRTRGDRSYEAAIADGLAFAGESLAARRAAVGGDGLDPERWSLAFGAHLLKTLHGLRAAGAALGHANAIAGFAWLAAELGELEAGGRFRIHARSNWSYLHAHCYALEGLLALRGTPLAREGSLVAGASWLASVQAADGGIPAWHDGSRAHGESHADATAQAVRLWAVLDRCALERPIARGLGFLARLQSAEGGIRYRPGSGDVNTWCTCFALQALRWADAEHLGDPLV